MIQERENLISEMMRAPLFARSFLWDLNAGARQKVYSYLKETPLGNLLEHCLSPEALKGEGIDAVDALFLQKILNDFINFKKIRERQALLPFGFIADLSIEEIQSVMRTAPIELKGEVLSHLPPSSAHRFLTALTDDERSQLGSRLFSRLEGTQKNALLEKEEPRLRQEVAAMTKGLL